MVTRDRVICADATGVIASFDDVTRVLTVTLTDATVTDASGGTMNWTTRSASKHRPSTPCNLLWGNKLLASHSTLHSDNFVMLYHLPTRSSSTWNINDADAVHVVACVDSCYVAISPSRVHLLTCTTTAAASESLVRCQKKSMRAGT
tara:strand:+ start:885 stop:1325 length:441 start_codon:yes stop_codon:yes gene_type:complete